MTAISVFSTFTNNHDSSNLSIENLDNFYMLSDSQLSLVKDKQFVPFTKEQKIFYNKTTSVVMGVAGSYNVGKKIIKQSLSKISLEEAIMSANSMDEKIAGIEKIVQECAANFGISEFTHDTTIVCNTVFEQQFKSIKFFIKRNSKTVQTTIIDPTEMIHVTFDGMDGESFKKYFDNNESSFQPHISPASKLFTSFYNFLYSGLPNCSGPPCQGVVINRTGSIKELSIKHKDGNFYRMGKVDSVRAFPSRKVDYRDGDFTFLTRSRI